MAVAIRKGVFTANTGTGNQTVNITTGGNWPASTTPVAVMLWATYETTDDTTADADNILSVGYGTRFGGATQQGYVTHFADDGVGTTDAAQGINTTALLKAFSAPTTPTVDYVCTLVSFGSDAFTINWSDAPASAIKIHYMVWGGDVSSACVHSFTPAAAASQDITVSAGFGKPDALIFLTTQKTTVGDIAANSGIAISAANRAGGFASLYRYQEATTVIQSVFQKARALVHITGNATIEDEATLNADDTAWPTDGYELTWNDQPSTTYVTLGLALKGTFTSAIIDSTVPTAAAPQTQNHAVSGTAKGALLFGSNIPANAAIDQTHADLGAFWVGGSDGTNEGCAGILDEDSNTAAQCHRWHRTTKAIQMRVPNGAGSGTLTSECDSSVSGGNFVLTWNDTDTLARVYGGIVFGEAAAGGDFDITAATETDTAQALTKTKRKSVTVGTSTETGQALNVDKRKSVTAGLETDTAQPLTKTKRDTLAPATSSEVAQPLSITHDIIKTLTPATETDVANSLAVGGPKTLGPALETDTARPLTFTKTIFKTLGAVVETDQAQPLTRVKRKTVVPATSAETAQALTKRKRATLTTVAEADLAVQLRLPIRRTLIPALELDLAVALSSETGGEALSGPFEAVDNRGRSGGRTRGRTTSGQLAGSFTSAQSGRMEVE